MNIDLLLSRRNSIYGVCAVWVVLFHVFDRLRAPVIPVVTDIICTGNIAVDIFIFFSGLCLALSAAKNHYQAAGWKAYYTKRLKRILIPYLIIAIPYYAWNAMAEHSGSLLRRAAVFLGNLSSANFWLNGTQTTWFAFGILLLYLIFPLLYSALSGKDLFGARSLALLAGSIAFAVLSSYIPVLKKRIVVWGRVPIFIIGVICGCHKDQVSGFFRRKGLTAGIAALMLVLLTFLLSRDKLSGRASIQQIYRFLLYIPMTLSILCLLSLPGPRKESGVLAALGAVSFEIYLVHITLLHPFKFYGLLEKAGYWSYLIVPLAAIAVSFAVYRLEKWIAARLDGGK